LRSAFFDYIEVFDNRERAQSGLRGSRPRPRTAKHKPHCSEVLGVATSCGDPIRARAGAEPLRWNAEYIGATLRHRDRSVRMADNDSPPEGDEVLADDKDELEEADEESFPASDPPATWSGPDE
jgi:hypothetical protein